MCIIYAIDLKNSSCTFVWSIHLDDISSDYLHRKLTFYGERVICVSTDLKNFCINKLNIPEDRISIVYNGINP